MSHLKKAENQQIQNFDEGKNLMAQIKITTN